MTGLRVDDPKAATLCRSLDRLWPALWTFVDEPGMEPTNNAAERALRHAVLWRKTSRGTDSSAVVRCALESLVLARLSWAVRRGSGEPHHDNTI